MTDFERYRDNSTRGSGPSCPSCGDNKNVALYRMKGRPSIMGFKAPFRINADSWACSIHSDVWIA